MSAPLSRRSANATRSRPALPQPREMTIVRSILEALRWDKRVLVWRQNTGAMRVPGVPGRKDRVVRFGVKGQGDLTGCVRSTGRRIEIEVKRPGEAQTPDQRAFAEVIRAAGGIYILVHSVEEARALLDEQLALEAARYSVSLRGGL